MFLDSFRKTKIIATLGPACSGPKEIRQLIDVGVNVFRINASHYQDSAVLARFAKKVRKVCFDYHKQVSIFLDLQGPKIRVGEVKKPFELKRGESISIVSGQAICTASTLTVSYEGLIDDVCVGESIFINDGAIRLKVTQKEVGLLNCEVLRGGMVSSHKGVNLPTTQLEIGAFTSKDESDALACVDVGLDYVALSFVSSADDVLNFRRFLDDHGGETLQIISKLERQLAVDNMMSIVEVSDAVMVARGDLGVEIGTEQVPKIQKMIIRECNRRIKPVIVATQMLESMISSEMATRAEVSDVANAIYDRCDAVMLSAETAVGINPINAVATMVKICKATDDHLDLIKKEKNIVFKHVFFKQTRATSICKAADQIAEENFAKAIMAFTSSGSTPLIASKLNSSFPIIAPTDCIEICQRMSVLRGVYPMMMPVIFKDIHRWTEMIKVAVDEALAIQLLQKGDMIVVTAGIPIGQSNGINSIRIVQV